MTATKTNNTTTSARKTNKTRDIFGNSAGAICRWFGATKGFTWQMAKLALRGAGVRVKDNLVRTMFYAGRSGLRGAPAKLTRAEQKQLRTLASA